MWTTIVSTLGGLLGRWYDGRVQISQAKAEAKVARWNAEAELAKLNARAELDWDMAALKASQRSWKDEYLTILLTIPLVLSFVPLTQPYVAQGWQELSNAPHWYWVCLMGIIAATFGLRWWFTQTKVKRSSLRDP